MSVKPGSTVPRMICTSRSDTPGLGLAGPGDVDDGPTGVGADVVLMVRLGALLRNFVWYESVRSSPF